MTEAIVVALITAVASIVVHFIGNVIQGRDLHHKLEVHSEQSDSRIEQKLAVMSAVTDTKLEMLTAEVRKHNGFAERMPVIEEKVDALDRRVSNLEHQ